MRAAIALDRDSSSPLHRQIYDQWRQGILTGRFRRADRVPSTRELSAELQVSRSTVTLAYEQLIAEGYLEPSRGAGTFVCRELPDEMLPHQRQARRREEIPMPRLSRYGAGLTRDFAYPNVPPGFICLTQWRPDLSLFPIAIWRKLMMRRLRSSFDVHSLLCEGGPTLFGALLQEDLIDELFLSMAAKLSGGGGAPSITNGPALAELRPLDLLWALELESALYLRYALR